MDWSMRRCKTVMLHDDPPTDDNIIGRAARVKLIKSPPRHRVLAAPASPINNMLAQGLFLALIGIVCQTALASMSLPDGIENILGFVPTSSFKCERDGYFGDIENDCRLFHLCQKQVNSNGRVEWRHWTYACGNQTMFNQLTLTCAFVDEAIPCRHASQFQYLNEVIHKPREPFLTDADVTSGISYYTNRIMSDGARNRAFEDSRLMAQLGGGSTFPNNQQFQNEFALATQNNRQAQTQFQQRNLNFQQQPPEGQSQQGLFFSPNQNQPTSDTDDSSSRTINSIELPDLPLSAAFQSLSRQATAAAVGDSVRQAGGQQDLVLINHSENHHHHRQQEQAPQLQLFAFPEGRFKQASLDHRQVLASEIPSPVTVLPATSTGDSSANIAGQQNPQQQMSVQRQPNPLASFNFAVSTDHQLGPSTSSHPTLFTSNGNSQQQLNHFNFQTTVPTLITSAQATQVPSLPATAPTIVPLATEQPTRTTTTTTPAAAATTTTAATTTVAIANTNAPSSTSTPSRLAEPTTTSIVANVTGSAPTASRAGSQGGPVTRAPSRASVQASRLSQINRRGAARASGDSIASAHPMRHFQSVRLSAMKQHQAHSQPQTTESAVVMRRQATTTVAAPVAAASSQAAPGSFGGPTSSMDESETFWRRPFDEQFMVPRFESLLTRRRV